MEICIPNFHLVNFRLDKWPRPLRNPYVLGHLAQLPPHPAILERLSIFRIWRELTRILSRDREDISNREDIGRILVQCQGTRRISLFPGIFQRRHFPLDRTLGIFAARKISRAQVSRNVW